MLETMSKFYCAILVAVAWAVLKLQGGGPSGLSSTDHLPPPSRRKQKKARAE